MGIPDLQIGSHRMEGDREMQTWGQSFPPNLPSADAQADSLTMNTLNTSMFCDRQPVKDC